MTDTTTQSLAAFLLARIAEDEAAARAATNGPWNYAADSSEGSLRYGDPSARGLCIAHTSWEHDFAQTPADLAHIARHDPARVLAESEAKRRIVELHQSWPVLVERPVEFDPSLGADLSFTDQVTMRAMQQIVWLTEQEYRNRFGDEPPTAPMLLALASVYADHPEFREEWR